MKISNFRSLTIILLLSLAACNMPGDAPNEDQFNEGWVLTAAAETVEAILTSSPNEQSTETPVPTLNLPDASPSASPSVQLTQPTETTNNGEPCNLATFITDVTVPDGEDHSAGDNFVKTWRLQNVGSCTWTADYEIVFYSGDSMSGPAAQSIGSNPVAPGEQLDVSVNLTAPAQAGTYRGNWKLRSNEGILFSFSNNKAFWVEIDVVP